jgi:tetratricopeptide (TPR) repeat protein
MKTSINPHYLISGAFLTMAAHAAGQGTPVLFLDGGYSEMCSAVAKEVKQPGTLTITGSRLDVPPLKICDLAIAEDTNGHRIASGNYNNRGVIHFSNGNYDAAIKDFEQAVRLQPDLAVGYANIGYTYAAQQRWADALQPLSRGIELNVEELHKAYYNRGIANEETGHINEAYRDYLKASELAPEWADPKRELTRFTVRKP